jgi:hypothetical protein
MAEQSLSPTIVVAAAAVVEEVVVEVVSLSRQ